MDTMTKKGGDTVRGWHFDWQEPCCVMDKSNGALELENVRLTLNWRYFFHFPHVPHAYRILDAGNKCPYILHQSKSNINTLAVRNLNPYNNTLLRHSIAVSERAWTITKTFSMEGNSRKFMRTAFGIFLPTPYLKWYGIGNKSILHHFTNHITKIPNCQKIRLFCGKWLTIKQVEQQGKPSGSESLQSGGHSVSRYLSFSWSLCNLDKMDKRAKEKCSSILLILGLLRYHRILLKLPASFQRDIFLFGKHLYLDRAGLSEWKRDLMSVTVSWKWQLTAASLWAINLRGI